MCGVGDEALLVSYTFIDTFQGAVYRFHKRRDLGWEVGNMDALMQRVLINNRGLRGGKTERR